MTEMSAALGEDDAARRFAVPQPTVRDYLMVCGALACFGLGLSWATAWGAGAASAPGALLGPIFALAALVGLVWSLMVIFRNYAVLRGIAKAVYYAEYRIEAPPDWVERPTRTFNNLMQIPTLFWVVSR